MSDWQPIGTAPKDGKIDIWAKMWAPAFDEFVYGRFPDCFWLGPDSMANRKGEWVGVAKHWRATHWMPRPDGPMLDEGATDPARILKTDGSQATGSALGDREYASRKRIAIASGEALADEPDDRREARQG